MTVVLITAVVLAGLLLWALYVEDPPPEPEPVVRPPRWEGLPTAADVRRADFPTAPLGYDRAAVEAHLSRVGDAFEALLTARTSVELALRRTTAEEVDAWEDRLHDGDDVDPPVDDGADVGDDVDPPADEGADGPFGDLAGDPPGDLLDEDDVPRADEPT